MTESLGNEVNALVLPESPMGLIALRDAVAAKLGSTSFASLTEDEILAAHRIAARTDRRAAGINAALFVELSDRSAFRKAGYMSPVSFLESDLRLGSPEARRRQSVALATGRLSEITGETRPPRLPATAAAIADGAIGEAHALVIDGVMDRIPNAVPPDVHDRAEAQLAEAARDLSPEGVRYVGHRLLAHLDPDGELTDDQDRRRTRGFTIQPQDLQLMSKIRARISPILRAKLEALLLQWAVVGMNNPDDPDSPKGAANQPGIDPAALTEAAARDQRSQRQRNHDALEAMFDFLIGNEGLGRPTCLPAHLVITASVHDIEARTGLAQTATGARVPVKDLVELAAGATPWLEVFENHSSTVLYLARGKRLANLAQRLALFGRDRGCTAPGCTQPFARTQAHHMPDWADGGPTDIDHLGAACGGHNRSVKNERGGWETTILDSGPYRGRVGWRPTGSNEPWRVNHSLQPEHLNGDDPPDEASDPRPA